MTPVALTIAGSDPSGGAGLQADLKPFHQRGVYGMAVISLLTVQNTKTVREVLVIDAGKVMAQLDALLEDMPCHAAKTGALGNERIVRGLAERAKSFRFPLVIDPVFSAKHGAPLLLPEGRRVLREELIPHASLVTPNLDEASQLAGFEVRDLDSMERAARAIAGYGAQAVLVKGGHLEGEAADLLFSGGKVTLLKSERMASSHTHGTGCTYSAAITAELAKGSDLETAVEVAKRFITKAIESSPGLGTGIGPLNHHVVV